MAGDIWLSSDVALLGLQADFTDSRRNLVVSGAKQVLRCAHDLHVFEEQQSRVSGVFGLWDGFYQPVDGCQVQN